VRAVTRMRREVCSFEPFRPPPPPRGYLFIDLLYCTIFLEALGSATL